MVNLKFTHSHEWVAPCNTDNSEFSIGITNHAQQLLGDMVFVELPKEGLIVNAGDELGVVESVKSAADFYSPISGTITNINTDVCKTPDLLNTDPYGEGWLVKIKPLNLEELNSLLSSEEYEHKIVTG